jgi:PAS domain S-box-containing protein
MSDKQQNSGLTPTDAAKLRKRAEKQARTLEPIFLSAQTPETIEQILHELRVHQIELEMQNEELRTAQEEIETGRARYFDLYDLAPVGYCTLSEHGLFLEANLTATTLLGVARSALVRQPISRFILKEDEDIYYLHRKQLFETGEPQEYELRLTKPDGTLIWVHLTSTIAQTEDGGLVCRVVLSDITERKQTEEALVRQQRSIKLFNRIANVFLTSPRNEVFADVLEVILKALDSRFGFFGYIDEAGDLVSPSMTRDVWDQCQVSDKSIVFPRSSWGGLWGRSLLEKQTLIANEKLQVPQGHVALENALATPIVYNDNLVGQFGEDINLVWLPHSDLWPIKMDPSQLDQLLANLCVNARDAIAGVGNVTIKTDNISFDEAYCSQHPGFLPGDYVLLAISDNGCGMDKDTLLHLFEPFFTTKEQGKGTGLGLATVYGVVKQNNGFINVFSEPDQGTIFKIYLPRNQVKEGRLQDKEANRPVARGHETILLTEDEPAILSMATMMLERGGYTVLAAGSPGEAIRLATEHAGDIHLLMTDVIMPEMNGSDLAKNILSLYPHLKCLFMSGYTANVMAYQSILDGGVNFIEKPFSRGELAAKVREVLGRNYENYG